MKKTLILLGAISTVNATEIIQKLSTDNFNQFKTTVEKFGQNKKDICVIYDLDNTLITQEPSFGGDHWASWNASLSKSDKRKVENWTLSNNFHDTEGTIRSFIKYTPTESITLSTVNYIKDTLHYSSIIMTARSYDQYYIATNNQLKANGFNFTTNPIGITGSNNTNLLLKPNKTNTAFIAYYNGVYYAAENNKANEIINLVLEQRKITKNKNLCKNIIFIDNAQKNVDNIYQTFIDNNAIRSNVLSIHYTYDDRLKYLESKPNSDWDINKKGSTAATLKIFINKVNK